MQVKNKAIDGEKHSLDINAIKVHKNFIYTGADDGKIIKWSEDLKKICEVEAHASSVYSLTSSDDTIYSCSNDGSIKAFNDEDLKLRKVLLDLGSACEFWKMDKGTDFLLVGDDQGTILKFVNDQLMAKVETLEGSKDLKVLGNRIYSGKDTDIIITDLGEGPRTTFQTRKVIQGRAPLCLTGQHLVFVDAPATGIVILENSAESNFKSVADVKTAHTMIINALCGDSGSNQFFSGGWDKCLKKWEISDSDSSCKLIESFDVGFVVNSIALHKDLVYVGGADGSLINVQ